jgi:hypothetical protein
MCRMLNLSTLTPDFVAAILDETLPSHITVHELAISPPVLWDEQRERIGGGWPCRPEAGQFGVRMTQEMAQRLDYPERS